MTEVRDPLADLAGLWQWFADTSCRGYSPLYERISRHIAEDRDLLELVRRAPPAAHQPALFLATVHFLVLEGLRHPLAEVYAGASSEDPGALFRDVCLSNSERILDLMASRTVQTNEVGRSAIIAPALSWVARTIGTPLEFVDVGASAGLNLLCDEYLLDYGEFGCTGPENAEVRIDCRVAGGRPPIERRLSSIARRVGIDRDPPDLSDPADALWQLACVWPDTNRLDRTRAAIFFAKRHPPTVVTGDALEVLPSVLANVERTASKGVVCVTTTWVFAYFSLGSRTRFVELLSDVARHRDVVWIAGEGAGIVDLVKCGELPDHGHGESNVLSAVRFDSAGMHPTLLGFAHPHGLWLDWTA